MSIESAMEGKEGIVENEESKDLNVKNFSIIRRWDLYYVDYKNNRFSLCWNDVCGMFWVFSTGNKMVPRTVFEKNDVITLVGKKKGVRKLEVTVGEFEVDYSRQYHYHGRIVPSSVKEF